MEVTGSTFASRLERWSWMITRWLVSKPTGLQLLGEAYIEYYQIILNICFYMFLHLWVLVTSTGIPWGSVMLFSRRKINSFARYFSRGLREAVLTVIHWDSLKFILHLCKSQPRGPNVFDLNKTSKLDKNYEVVLDRKSVDQWHLLSIDSSCIALNYTSK